MHLVSLGNLQFSSVQLFSHVQLFATTWTTAHQASLSITNSWSLLKFMSIKLVMPFNHLILYVPLSSCLQSLPASGTFQMNQFFATSGQSIEVSASTLVLSRNIQDWFPLGLTGWISLQSKGLSRVFSNTIVQKHKFFGTQLSLWYHYQIYIWLLEKNIALTRQTFVDKVMSLLFNMLSRLVITFLPRSKHLLISWLQSPSAVILEPRKIKSVTVSTVSPSIYHESDGTGCQYLSFLNAEL